MKKTTLLIDLDGTLLGSHKIFLKIGFLLAFCVYFLSRIKNPWPRLKAIDLIQRQLEQGYANKALTNNRAAALALYGGRLQLTPDQSRAELFGATGFAFRMMRFLFFEITEAQDFLNWARPRYRLVLATNPFWPVQILRSRMAWGKIDDSIFDWVTTSENMSFCKPHPSYYSEVLEKIKATPDECIMIGDDARKDLPAKDVGIEVFLISKKNRLQSFNALRGRLEK